MRCPAHLDDVDLFAPGAQEHWYEAYDILHAEAPVHRIPGEGFGPGTDAFILTKHEDIAKVVRDQERYPVVTSLALKGVIEAGGDPFELPNVNTLVASMVSLRPNPELWRAHRQELTDPWVGPGAGRNREMVERVANELVDRWIERGEVEFVSEFAQPLPHTVMANVLGWPLADLKLLKHFGDGTVKPFVYGRKHNNQLNAEEAREQFEVLEEFKRYTDELIDEKRKTPAEDMISFLTQVEYSPLKRKLRNGEINGIVYAMVIGGLETTQYALAEQVQLLIEREGVWDALKADRGKVRAFTEEGMRLRSPTQGLSTRVTSQDEVFQGVPVPKGSYLHLRWAGRQHRPGRVAGSPATEARPPGGHPAPDVLCGPQGLPRRPYFAFGTDCRLEYAARPHRPVRVRGGQRLPASAGHHVGHLEAESAVCEGVNPGGRGCAESA